MSYQTPYECTSQLKGIKRTGKEGFWKEGVNYTIFFKKMMNVDIENTKEGRYGGTGLESQHSEMCRQEDHKFESSVGNLPI